MAAQSVELVLEDREDRMANETIMAGKSFEKRRWSMHCRIVPKKTFSLPSSFMHQVLVPSLETPPQSGCLHDSTIQQVTKIPP
jgi:hypothetical protein